MIGKSTAGGRAKGGAAAKIKLQTNKEPEENKAFHGTTSPHELYSLGGFTLYRSPQEQRLPGDYNILCSQKALSDVFRHLKEDTNREHGGLLLGYETGLGTDGVPTVVVLHALRGNKTDGTATSLTFALGTWAEWDSKEAEIDSMGVDLKRVGWYHSHPNIEIFLSRYDLDVCTTFDRLRCPLALVYDPIRDQGGFFVRGTEGYRHHSPQSFWTIGVNGSGNGGVTWTNVERVAAPEAVDAKQIAAAVTPAVQQPQQPLQASTPISGPVTPVAPTVTGSNTMLLANIGWRIAAGLVLVTTLVTSAAVLSLRDDVQDLRETATKDREDRAALIAAMQAQNARPSIAPPATQSTSASTTPSTAGSGTTTAGPVASTAAAPIPTAPKPASAKPAATKVTPAKAKPEAGKPKAPPAKPTTDVTKPGTDTAKPTPEAGKPAGETARPSAETETDPKQQQQ